MKGRLLSVALIYLFALPSSGATEEILRDTWGIPHIFADTDAEAFYGLG